MEKRKLNRWLYAPPASLRIIAVNLVLWIVLIPLVMLLREGDQNWFLFAICGVAFIPIVLILHFLQRALWWIFVRFYWYWVGALASFGIILGIVTLFMLIVAPDRLPVTVSTAAIPGMFSALLPFIIVGSLVALILFKLLFRSDQKLDEWHVGFDQPTFDEPIPLVSPRGSIKSPTVEDQVALRKQEILKKAGE